MLYVKKEQLGGKEVSRHMKKETKTDILNQESLIRGAEDSHHKNTETEKKLLVLSQIGQALNDAGIVWAVGASLLLYFKGKTDTFHDIDIMITESDVKSVKEILIQYGKLALPSPDKQYRTKHFLEFTIDDVEIDVMAGFVIVCDEVEYDCSLDPESISDFTEVNEVKIPLQSLDEWRRYYKLMGRTTKVEMIDR